MIASVSPAHTIASVSIGRRRTPELGAAVGAGRRDPLLRSRSSRSSVAHAEGDAAGQAAADQARLRPVASAGTTSPASTRPRRSCRRSSSSCATPEQFADARAQACPRASSCTARPAPARRCSRRPSRTSPARSSSPSRPPRSSRCSPASAPPASGELFAIARKNEPAIIFIDELDAVGGRRGVGHLRREGPDAQPAAVEMDGFGSTRAPRRDRRLEPARQARPGAAATRAASTARSSSRRPTCKRPRGDPRGAHAATSRVRRRRPRARRPADQRG